MSIIPSAQFVQKFGTAAASGTAPDVASIDLVFLPYFASQGALEDITDVASGLPYKDSLSPAHRRLATYEGKTYALPFTAEASILYYNKDLFKKAGLDPSKPPTNFAEIEADAKKLRALGKDYYGFAFAGACGGCNVFEFTPHVWGSGGDVLSSDGKKAMLDTPQVTDALQFYRVDEIVISTFPGEKSGWLRMDLVGRTRSTTSLPVEHIEAQPASQSARAEA